MKFTRLIFSALILILLFTGNLNGQTYRSSLALHYGLFQFNSAQNQYFFDADGNFLNAGLSYKYKLGRLSSLSITGRYYDWTLNDFQTLNTQALQGMWLIHAGRISTSWRVNLITPYIGAGIGYEMHTLTQNGSDRNFANIYLPLEAGLNINLSRRWSLGIFAEYKLDRATKLKNRLGLKDSYPGVVNAAGVTLSYHFGQPATDVSVPLVTTNPFFTYPDEVIDDEKTPGIAETLPEPVAEPQPLKDDVSREERKVETVVFPQFISPVMDTLRIPVIIDLKVRGLDEDTGKPLRVTTDSPAQPASYENKIDTLIRLTSSLSQRIAQLERAPATQFSQREIHSTQPLTLNQARQPSPLTTQMQSPPAQPAQIQATQPLPQPTTGADAGDFATKTDIELLRSEIRQLATDNREAMSTLRRDIRVVSIPDRPIPDVIETEKPALTVPVDTIPEPADSIPEFKIGENVVTGEDSLKPDKPGPELKAVLDSVAAVEISPASEPELPTGLIIDLMEESFPGEKARTEEPMEVDEDIYMEYSVTFGVNAASLSADHIIKIAEFAKQMKDNPELKIQLSGYADGTGDPEYNALLSQWRVQAVRNELIRLGISRIRILEQYFGSQNATGGSNQDDRRVDMQILLMN